MVEKAVRIIREIELAPEDVEKYENCEIISDLLNNEMLGLIEDLDLRKVIRQMRNLHREIRKENYRGYVHTTKELFGKILRADYVLRYHQLEQLSNKLNDSEIKKIRDKKIREVLQKVKHVHENIADKKANLIKKMNIY